MVTPSAGSVVPVRFPFSDLTSSKLRPAVIVASSGMNDWVLCQVTSNPYADTKAIVLTDEDFTTGSLQRTSFARPGKLFTANENLMTRNVGRLSQEAFGRIADRIIEAIENAKSEVPGPA